MSNTEKNNTMDIFDTIKTQNAKIQSNSNLINEMVRVKNVNVSVHPFANSKDSDKQVITTSLNVISTVDIENDPNIIPCNDDFYFDALDKMILDSIMSICFQRDDGEDNLIIFTPHDIIRDFSGSLTTSSPINKNRVKEVDDRIKRMMNTNIKVNCKDEVVHRNVKEKNIKQFLITEKMLPVSVAEKELYNGTNVKGYVTSKSRLLACPLTRYILLTKQIITVPVNNYGALEVRDSNEYDIIQMYILSRITIMKNENNHMANNRIKFDSYDAKDKKHGLYNYVGLCKENFANTGNWNKKRKSVINVIDDILKHQVQTQNIKDYNFTYDKDNIANSVKIIL